MWMDACDVCMCFGLNVCICFRLHQQECDSTKLQTVCVRVCLRTFVGRFICHTKHACTLFDNTHTHTKTILSDTKTKTHKDYLVAIVQDVRLEFLYVFGSSILLLGSLEIVQIVRRFACVEPVAGSGILLLGSLLQCAYTGRLKNDIDI